MRKRSTFFILILALCFGALEAQSDTVFNQTDARNMKQGYWKKSYPDGKLMYKGFFKDNKPAGEMHRYFESGALKALLNYDKSGESANAVLYYENGQPAARGKYFNTLKDSTWIYYSYYDKSVTTKESYIKGVRHGLMTNYYSMGDVSEKIEWKNDKKSGLWEQYFKGNIIRLKASYVDNKLDGEFIVYYENTRPYVRGTYVNDLREGVWTFYNEDGTLASEYKYHLGKTNNDEKLEKEQQEFFKMIDENQGKFEEPDETNFLSPPKDKPENKTGRTFRYFLASWAILSIFTAPVFNQDIFERIAPDKYLIEFTDKLNSPFTLESPEEYLSPKALERRRIQGISISQNDLPVNFAYIDSLKNAGASVLTISKWLNEAAVQISDSIMLDRIARFPFVKKYISKIPVSQTDSFPENRLAVQEIVTPSSLEYGASWLQVAVHNGQYMHNHGYTGENITIAVIDAGFSRADVLPAFENMWGNNRILGSRNMITPGSSVYGYSGHGMSVLSIIGGFVPGELIGSAPDASFWLIKSEDAASEYIIEENYWIAAAEFADSVGVDIINTSLGYSEFNDKTQNHTYSDMDGNTTRISRAADIAASKGILVVVSAGNQGHKPWKYITAPADADSVLTIGAVDPSLNVTAFSGRGPSSDNQVKPDVMAIGQGIYVSKLDGTIDQGSGTSFSAPLITGLAACLWQANPDATAMEIRAAINKSADRFAQPDNNYGYGIPDFNMANALLKLDEENGEIHRPVYAFPNPFNTQLYIVFKSGIHTPVDITLYDLSGNEVMRSTYPPFSGRTYLKIEGTFDELPKGAYIIRICTGDITENSKLIKF